MLYFKLLWQPITCSSIDFWKKFEKFDLIVPFSSRFTSSGEHSKKFRNESLWCKPAGERALTSLLSGEVKISELKFFDAHRGFEERSLVIP